MRFDIDRIAERINELGTSPHAVSKALKFGAHFVEDLISGRRAAERSELWRLVKLVNYLDLDLYELIDEEGDNGALWNRMPPNQSVYEAFGDDIWRTTSWLTCTRCVHTYMLVEPNRVWFQRQSLLKLKWPPRDIDAYVLQQKERNDEIWRHHTHKDADNLVHRLILRRAMFAEAARVEPDWPVACADIVRQMDGRTVLSIAEDEAWKIVLTIIGQWFGTTEFCSLEVIGKAVALVRPQCGGDMFYTRHRRTVERLRHAVTAADRALNQTPKGAIDMLSHIARKRA